ncbi:MAG: flagellar motor switch protein FliM [Acidobacteriia bacterium]|nr:flagellar motor switch protein FliM [Terriglobia bacterium]
MAAVLEALDFSRLDRVPSAQLRAVHTLYEDFARSLSANLSAYLRNTAELSVASLDQTSYSEYLEGLASPTCLAYVSLKPHDGAMVMEISTQLAFMLVELLLGGPAKEAPSFEREITDIEKGILQGAMRVVLSEMQQAWKRIDEIRFALVALAGEPQTIQVVAPGERVLSITLDVKIGPAAGVVRLAIPSGLFKRLRGRFEQNGPAPQKADGSEQDRTRMTQLISDATLAFEARLEPTRVSAADLVDLEPGDVLMLGHALDRPVIGTLNGQPVYRGHLVMHDGKFMLQVHDASPESTKNKFVRPPSI